MKCKLFSPLLLLIHLCSVRCNRNYPSNEIRTNAKSEAVLNGMKNSICSGMAAACAKTLLAPFDTIKTIQQQARSTGKAIGLVEAAGIITSRPKGFLELYVS